MPYRSAISAAVVRPLLAVCLASGAGGAAAESPAYFGLKGGVVTPDVVGLDYAINGGLTMGYAWGQAALEAEFTATVIDGGTDFVETSWQLTSLGLYAALRGTGSVYWKARAGVMDERLRFNTVGIALTGDNSPWSLGGGVGFQLRSGRRVEGELTWLDKDILLWSVGVLF